MALAKISLKLGKKTIELTPAQFEELKRDMRELDKSHHYYWHRSPWYEPWYHQQSPAPMFTYTNAVAGNAGVNMSKLTTDCASNSAVMLTTLSTLPEPPEYKGSVLSVM